MANLLLEKLRQIRLDAVLAIESSDFATAYAKLLAAKAIIDTAPSHQEKDQLIVEFRDYESLMKRVQNEYFRSSGAGKVRRVRTPYVPPYLCRNDRFTCG